MKKRFFTLVICTLVFASLLLVFSSCGVDEKSILDFAKDDIENSAFVPTESISFTYSGSPLYDVGSNGFLVTLESDTTNHTDTYRIYSVYTGTEIKSFKAITLDRIDGDVKETYSDQIYKVNFKDTKINDKKYISVLVTLVNSDSMIYLFDTDGNTVLETETDLDYSHFGYYSANPFEGCFENHFTLEDKLYRLENNKAVFVCDKEDMVTNAKYINGKYIVTDGSQILIFNSSFCFEKAFTVSYEPTSSQVIPLESGNFIVIDVEMCDESSKKYDIITNNSILGGTIKAKLTTKLLTVPDLTFEEIDNYEYDIDSTFDFGDDIEIPDGKTLVYARRLEDKRPIGNIVFLLLDEKGKVEAEIKVPEGVESIERLADGKFKLSFDYGEQVVNSAGEIVYNLGRTDGEYLGADYYLVDGDVLNSSGETVISKDSYEQINPFYNGCMIITKYVDGQGVQHFFWNKGTETQISAYNVTSYNWGYKVVDTNKDLLETTTYYNAEGNVIKELVDSIDTSISSSIRFYGDCLVILVTDNGVTTAYSYK